MGVTCSKTSKIIFSFLNFGKTNLSAMNQIALLSVFLLGLVNGDTCQNPKVTVATAYTPTDAQVLSHIPFVGDFSLACSNGPSKVKLHADVKGTYLPVIRVGEPDSNRYQISWTEEVKKAAARSVVVDLYDDEGYSAVKRALDKGEDPKTTVKPLTSVTIDYPGAYKGPWFNSELIASVAASLVFYFAYSSKASLLA